ncbi:MAG: hypothetical protein PWQ91_563 [Eubacteriales bacterium]|nr:hypothetical protein [Eubacteriales bacterium]
MRSFFDALQEMNHKVKTAFFSWGTGVLLMLAYGFFIYWLKKVFNNYVMILGALFFLVVSFYFIDLWWHYQRLKHLQMLDGVEKEDNNRL